MQKSPQTHWGAFLKNYIQCSPQLAVRTRYSVEFLRSVKNYFESRK